MSQIAVTIKIDENVKKQAQALAKNLGLSMSAIVENNLKQTLVDRRVIFEEVELMSPAMTKTIAEAEKEIKNGELSPGFDNVDDAIAWLNDNKRVY